MPIEELEKMLRENPPKPVGEGEKIEDLVQEPQRNPDETAMFTPHQVSQMRERWSKIKEQEETPEENPDKNILEDLLEE